MNDSYTIIIIGEWNSANLGDKTLCTTYELLLKDLYPNVKTIRFDISSRTGSPIFKRLINKVLIKIAYFIPTINTIAQSYSKSVLKHSIKTLLYRILNKKGNYIAVVAGGALIQDYFALSLNVIGELLEECNIPVIYNAIGVGNIKKETSKQIFKKLLTRKNIRSISARDNLRELNFTNLPIKQIPDVAICCSQFYHIPKPTKKIIGLGIVSPELYFQTSKDPHVLTKSEYDQIIIKLIKKIHEETQLPIKIFSNGSHEDYLYATQIYKKFSLPSIEISPRPTNDLELISLISSFSFIIANRLHAQIIAYSFGIPTYGILWDEKVKYWYEYIHKKDQCNYLSDILNVNFSPLTNFSFTQEDIKRKNELQHDINQFIINSFSD